MCAIVILCVLRLEHLYIGVRWLCGVPDWRGGGELCVCSCLGVIRRRCAVEVLPSAGGHRGKVNMYDMSGSPVPIATPRNVGGRHGSSRAI